MDTKGLVKVLDGMRLEDGKPDLKLRSSAIQEFLHSPIFTFGELRMLKTYYDGLNFHHDIIANLPVELIVLVLKELDLEDFMLMRRVSRKWRGKLSSTRVCSDLLRLHFRGTWEREYRFLSDENKKSQLEKVAGMFPDMCKRRLKRLRGRYHFKACYDYKPIDLELGDPLSQFQYRNGRVATKTLQSSVVVDNLRTGASTTYTEEQRVPMDSWLLSDKFLLACINIGKPHITAWLLDHEADPINARLENHTRILAAHNNQVALLGRSQDRIPEVLIWTIGGPIQKVHTSTPWFDQHPPSWKFYINNIIFHPAEEKHFFIFYQPYMNNRQPIELLSGLLVQEIIEGKSYATWKCNLASSPNQVIPYVNIIEAMDDDGLVFMRLVSPKNAPAQFSEHAIEFQHDTSHLQHLMSFNIFTQEFNTYSIHVDKFMGYPPSGALFWRNQAVILHNESIFTVVLSFDICRSRTRHGAVCEHPHDHDEFTFSLVANKEPFYDIDMSLWGDDDFLVYKSNHEWIIWGFDEDVPLPDNPRLTLINNRPTG